MSTVTKPHIVLEGPDGTGKTTLAKYLVKHEGYTYHHEGVPQGEDMLVYYARLFLEKIKEGPMVFDRLHLGEHVYGPIMRNSNKMQGLAGVRLMDMLLQAKGARVVMCLPPYGTALANWKQRKGAEYVQHEERFLAIYNEYSKLYINGSGYYLYDYTTIGMHTVVPDLRIPRRVLPEDMIGNPFGNIVLVGERPNQHLDLPFFATGGSSGFLHSVIPGKLSEELVLCNAYDPYGGRHNIVGNLFNMYPRPRVIVGLGALAGVELKPIAINPGLLPYPIDIVKMDHPQYVKRFQSSRKQEYVQYFERLAELVPSGKVHGFKL